VSLPGQNAEPVEVESGTHTWSFPYRDPDGRQPVSVDTTIAEMKDNPAAWTAVTETITRLIPQNVFVVNMLQSQGKKTLRRALASLPNSAQMLTAIEDALASVERSKAEDS